MTGFTLECIECGASYAEDADRMVCARCSARQRPGGPVRGILAVRPDALPTRWPDATPNSAAFLSAFLPVAPNGLPAMPVGATPLVAPERLRRDLGMPRLWIKDDRRNPSGSTKDRASLLVVAKALGYGLRTVATASTGNAAIALAAVAASVGVRAVVFVPAAAPPAKIRLLLRYGATVLPVAGSYDDAFELCQAACARFGWYNRNTALNPFTIEGKKTVALEIARGFAPAVPDTVIVPTGDGVILSGLAKGFTDLRHCGLIDRLPRLIAVQPTGSSAIVQALEAEAEEVAPVDNPASIADSLVVASPRGAIPCLAAIRASGGGGVTVSEEAILAAGETLAQQAGLLAEPSAAAAYAGLLAARERGLVDRVETTVLLLTGAARDPTGSGEESALPTAIDATLEALADRLGLSS